MASESGTGTDGGPVAGRPEYPGGPVAENIFPVAPDPTPVATPVTPVSQRLPVGLQIGVALLFLYLVLVYFDRRFLLVRRRPEAEPQDVGLDLVQDHVHDR
ncbi:hypothetical protein CryarDRAFT_1303 [Cryptosporangium arvum DSM 44712]|uniref:Uncharacterized protein n=2 Tax=Cryptosporangium TaxID=65502 RepID=A0A010ZSP1_9ACTN|nr:hypothetical protein CryarDRAFT_1303 [Cryptosporangium arvum DSM 44712]